MVGAWVVWAFQAGVSSSHPGSLLTATAALTKLGSTCRTGVVACSREEETQL